MNSAVTLEFAAAAFGLVTAVLAAFLERRSLASWFFVGGMVLLSADSALSGLMTYAPLPDEAAQWEDLTLVVKALVPGVWLFFSLCYARGNYREFVARWQGALAAAVVIPLILVATWRGQMVGRLGFPLAAEEWVFPLTAGGWGVYLVSLLASVAVLMNLERTFWASVGTMRWRIKFMVLGLGLLFAVRFYTLSQGLVLPTPVVVDGKTILVTGPQSAAAAVNAAALLLGCLLMMWSLFRRSSETSVYPSHKDLHKSVTVLVAGCYLLIVGVLAKLVQRLGLTDTFAFRTFLILVGLVGVTVLLLSERVRLHGRQMISRYLHRPLYDYRTVWRRFTEGTANRVTQEELCQACVKLAAELFQSLSVSIWLVDDKRENLAMTASTLLSAPMAQTLKPSREETMEIMEALRNRLEPVDVEYTSEKWTATLRRCHPSQFGEGSGRVCVPMITAGELQGVMILGDRVGGMLFSLQDYDLLKCVGDHIAASLLNSQLSQRLLQAKEMEAFQTMSAFFVHDLKNTAHTLNLMLKNLPVHFDNPAFREDALRGIAKSGQHINHLIQRLSVLRHNLQIKPEESDLNDLVSKIVASWKGSSAVALTTDLGAVSKFPFDAEQIHKVVTNLVLNAAEAVPAAGRIRVETSQRNGWAVITVADNGCGMAPEFIQGSLFRPFQTTKKDGFGIGMFQSKMIVEAHGGRVEVESELNKGTTFRVLLPVIRNNR